MKKLNRTAKYLILLCTFLLAADVFLGCVLIRQSIAAIRTMIEKRMLDVSNTAAAMLDGDLLENLEAGSQDTPEYQQVLKTLNYFLDNIELEYIYLIRDLGGGNFVFMIDPDHNEPGEFGDPIVYTEALYQASLGTPSVDAVPYQDKWGRFYSAYTPVFNSAHKVTGIVSVDFSADWYEKQVYSLVQSTAIVILVSIIFASIIIILITIKYRKHFLLLFNKVNAVSDGIETLVKEISPGAETVRQQTENTIDSDDEIALLNEKLESLVKMIGDRISFVRSQAFIDGMTGLGNRTAYEDHVKRLDDEAKEGRGSFSIAVFDINGLKEINDREGHEKGDEVIKEAAALLKKTFANTPLYRIGGDEFIVIKEEGFSNLQDLIEKIRSGQRRVSMSMGCAVFIPETDSGYHSVFNRADNAMYEDKKEYYLMHERRRMREKRPLNDSLDPEEINS